VLLGVTPEYAHLVQGVVAIEHNEAMIAALWPHKRRNAVRGDWLHLPLRAHACVAIIGDGTLNNLLFASDYTRFFAEAARALKAGGRLVLRTFVRPEQAVESCQALRERARNAEIGSFHAFKWRLAMALAAEAGDSNVAVARIHQAFDSMFPDRRMLAASSGWDEEAIGTIDVYRGSRVIYSFPKLSEMRCALAPKFIESDLAYGSYELAERCPVIVLESQA